MQEDEQKLLSPLSCCSLHVSLLISSLLICPPVIFLSVGIMLQAVPAAPVSLMTISVAIMMFQLFCRLSALCGEVAPGEKLLGIQTDTLRSAKLPLVNSWYFKHESLNSCRMSLLQAALAARVKQLLHSCGCIKSTQRASLLSSKQPIALV